jgi:hypothetical protein
VVAASKILDPALVRRIANVNKRCLLLTVSRQPKADKGVYRGVLTAVLHLLPADMAGGPTFCAGSTAGCRATCLNMAGRGGIPMKTYIGMPVINNVQAARMRKSRLFLADPAAFVAQLIEEIALLVAFCAQNGLMLAVRLNGTSDIPWERVAPVIFATFPHVTFYDYTALPGRFVKSLPSNYTLTFSRKETARSQEQAARLSARGVNVAVVFGVRRGKPLPTVYMGRPVIDGDRDDLRFLDPSGVIVGLRAKGPAKRDNTGFVVREVV